MPASAVSSPTALDAHADRGVGRDGAGDDLVALALGHRLRLAGDHRLVELGLAVDDLAVGGHARARAHEHDVAGVGARRAARARSPRRAARSASSGSSSASALSAPRAWPSAFISCQCPSSMITTSADELPPELEVEEAERRRRARDEGDADRERDEQHHPGGAPAKLRPGAGQEDGSRRRRRSPCRAPARPGRLRGTGAR